MQIVIDIPENTVNAIKDNAMFAKPIADQIQWDVTSAIVNGTSLPKGHGRLIDADVLLDKTVRRNSAWNSITNSEGKTLEEIVSEMPIIQSVPIDVLDKIREQIELEKLGYPPSAGYYRAIIKVLQIIDKYRAESEG